MNKRYALLSDTLALKGGTAINLIMFDLPRLSVDIDMDYAKDVSREAMLQEREQITEIMDYEDLHLRFSLRGCEMDIWLRFDLEYNLEVTNHENRGKRWLGATVILHDGFVYFMEGKNMSIEEIDPQHFYVKARNMIYRVVPD